jgi:hypothetical protein
MRIRPLFAVLAVQVLLGAVLIVLVATGSLPFTGDGEAAPGRPATVHANRFDGPAAFRVL